MKPFALHSVLRYRRQLEDAARRELHRALQAEARLLETLARVQADLAELYAGLDLDRIRQRAVAQGLVPDAAEIVKIYEEIF